MKPSQRLRQHTQGHREAEAARQALRAHEESSRPLRPGDAAGMATVAGVLFIPILTLILSGGTNWLSAFLFSTGFYTLGALYFVVRCWLYWR